jgi:hypothetical protein
MVNIQKYFVISPCPRDDILVLVLKVHQVVVGGWISQSDEIVKDHTSCDDFSACLVQLQLKTGPPLLSSSRGDGNFHNAFGISKRLMNPFAIRNMEHHERIFNYRLSRARRVVENAFGILAHKFRVLLRTMNQRPETCRKITTTCVDPL